MKQTKLNYLLMGFLAFIFLSPELMAAGAGGALPWEAPLTTIVNSITGPVAFGISVIAIVAAGAMLVFGGEIGQFLKAIILLALVISLIVMATNVLTTVFGVGGATI
jgi:type IV secretion system protein VirB2